MPSETHDHGTHEKRRRKKKRSFGSRLKEKLISKQFNIYQAILAIVVASLAYQMLIWVAERPNSSSEPSVAVE